jgi:hypothetical protein
MSSGINMLAGSGGCADQEYPMLIGDGANPKCCSTKAMTCCNVKRCCDNRPGHGDCCDTK